ncbi:hypothetical protein QJS10_CPB14g01581 [Acorus calamus]|uniref:Exostosin GT47 domain-containing protein n=1 Tax=Acorus calamus TaxID=4465 RepID=A0AAV9DGD9_ACOCL|nr:hypothetical protein QJS10_CPB14g01581 [Acorus calamus]
MEKINGHKWRSRSLVMISLSVLFWVLLFHSNPSDPPLPTTTTTTTTTIRAAAQPAKQEYQPRHDNDSCLGRYIYVHDLPHRFNMGLIDECGTLSTWTNMCTYTSNAGLGPRVVSNPGRVFPDTSCWHETNQFTLELIFYNRMKKYPCLTEDSSRAAAVYVPYFPGLDVARYLWGHNNSARDAMALDLVRWLRARPEWGVMGGRDHFMVGGRITWDFRRMSEEENDWGNKLLMLPEVKNMSTLVIEASPYDSIDIAIPYPTYFHPSRKEQVLKWQQKLRTQKRPYLFSFVGAPRPNIGTSIRDLIIHQCKRSKRCALLQCDKSSNKKKNNDCHSAGRVMKLFSRSVFCLQPQGDSYTRRSTFDAILGGCIPVFFHPGSAYVQYEWHLPREYGEYSVFVGEEEVRTGKGDILEKRLVGIGKERVREMRERVIGLVPKLVYGDPRGWTGEGDAFDVAVEGVIERVRRRREGVVGGEERRGKGEWESYFS